MNGSPARANETTKKDRTPSQWHQDDGYGHLAHFDPEVHLPEDEGAAWKWKMKTAPRPIVFVPEDDPLSVTAKGASPPPVVAVDARPEPAPVPAAPEPVPEVEATPEPAPVSPAPRVEAATTARPSGKTPRKFEHLEALRGRLGNGDHQLTRTEYVALVMLSTYASADLTSAHPGHACLARDLGYTGSNAQRTVRELLASLIRKGYVVVTRKGSNVGGNVPTVYRLTLPEWG